MHGQLIEVVRWVKTRALLMTLGTLGSPIVLQLVMAVMATTKVGGPPKPHPSKCRVDVLGNRSTSGATHSVQTQ